MILAREFKEMGAHLHPGEQLRIDHVDCPAGRDTKGRLYVKRKDDDTLLAYCHNCGDYGISSSKGRVKAIRDLLIENEAVQRDGSGELLMPSDVLKNPDTWPPLAYAWPRSYGITGLEMRMFEMCYSPSWNRVILPVYESGKLVFWQGRAIEKGQDPKYISAKSHPKVMFWALTNNKPRDKWTRVFIVEDMLSAIKMSRYCDTVALLGTSPDIDGLTKRLANYDKVGIFLDPDTAGVTKANELSARMSCVFMGQRRVFIESKQPKEMTNAELERMAIGL